MSENSLIMVRNSDFAYDSKMKKEANAALKLGMKVIVLSWIRDGSVDHPETIRLQCGDVRVIYCYKTAEFGKGFKNAFNILCFNIWIFHQLLALKKEYRLLIANDLDVAFPAYLISRLHSKKIIFNMVDSYAQNHRMPVFLNKITTKLENQIVSLVDAVIVCNEARLAVTKKAMPKKCVVVHNSPDMESYSKLSRKMCKRDSKNFRVTYVGTLTDHGRLLVEIISEAHKYPEIELHIGGFGPLAEHIENAAQKYSNIFYYGQLQNDNALKLQSESDLLFATYDPSIAINKHAAPLKLYEAMALCKPIIVCKDTTADVVTLSNGMGLAINYDAGEFWDAVIYLAKNTMLCEKMGLSGRKAYDEKYNWKIMEERLATLYGALV